MRKKIKKILCMLLSVFILSACTRDLSSMIKKNNGIIILLDEKEIVFNEYFPYIDDNKILQVPLKDLEEIFNMSVSWDSKRLTAFVIKDNKKISFSVGDNNLMLDGKSIAMKSNVYEIAGIVYVPIESVLKVFDYNFEWDMTNKKLNIKSPNEKNISLNFACKIANRLDQDYFFSPLSIKLALGMLANGVTQELKQEIIKILDVKDLNEFNNYAQKILEQTQEVIANSIWLNESNCDQENISFNKNFVDNLEKYFQGGFFRVNNINARDMINNWVAERTNEKIKNAIDSDDFLIALVNIIYFNAPWKLQFDPENNVQDNFYCVNNNKAKIDFMCKEDFFDYFECEFYKIIKLGYKDSNLSLYVILPETKDFSLDKIIFDKLNKEYVDLRLPKFKREFSMSEEIKKILVNLGLEDIFKNSTSEFMFENLNSQIKIDKIIHKAFINLDEYGTEAAASTVISMTKSAMPTQEKKFYANKNFKYIIRDDSNGEIFFIGDFSNVE